MTRYWFRPKRYGYGATPVTWQGWCSTVAFVLVMIGFNGTLRLAEKHYWALAVLLAVDAIAIAVFVIVSKHRTDGEWRWRWGGND
jgi:hypothetical protein